ncbi:MAG: hypothetical protein QOD88_1200 [Mycobacterium sp.]|jgi:hypothetical protein|nr:hypothetical protein [Mycobacterium sp.]
MASQQMQKAMPNCTFGVAGTRLQYGHSTATFGVQTGYQESPIGAFACSLEAASVLAQSCDRRHGTVTLCAACRLLIRKKSFRMGWDMGVRVGFFVGLAIGAIGLGAAPVVVSAPAMAVAGCGAGFYRNSDGDCIPDPSNPLGGRIARERHPRPGHRSRPGHLSRRRHRPRLRWRHPRRPSAGSYREVPRRRLLIQHSSFWNLLGPRRRRGVASELTGS